MSRVTKVIPPDGNSTSDNTTTVYDIALITSTYDRNCTTVTDEAGKARESCVDGLDRLTQVFEDPNGLDYETDYAYDTLDNLLSVTQHGGSPSSGNWRHGPSVVAADQHRRVNPGVDYLSGHRMADLVPTRDGPNDAAHSHLLRG